MFPKLRVGLGLPPTALVLQLSLFAMEVLKRAPLHLHCKSPLPVLVMLLTYFQRAFTVTQMGRIAVALVAPYTVSA